MSQLPSVSYFHRTYSKLDDGNVTDYEKLFGNNINDQIEIAKCVIENIKIRKKLVESKPR